MALHISDSFSSIISSTGKNASRVASLAWLIAAHEDESLLDWNPNLQQFKSDLKEYMDKNTNSGIFIKDEMLKLMAPQKCIDWINNSHRQLCWIKRYISNLNEYKTNLTIFSKRHETPRTHPHYLTQLNLNIAYVDYWMIRSFKNMSTAVESCEQMEAAWKKHIDSDKLFSWLDGVDAEEKRELFWSVIKEKLPNYINDGRNFNSHEELLIFFDNPIITKDTKELYSQKARKSWNQRVRRENEKDRKQCNFLLPIETIEKLYQLSKKHGVSRTEIIQILIDSEHKKNVHISEKLSRKIQLMTPLD